YRSRPRWSAGKKMDAVLRLLRGEPLETLSRELGVEAHRLGGRGADFLEGGKEALKGQRPNRSGDDRVLRQAERKVGQLTWRTRSCGPRPKKGGGRSRPASGPHSHGAQPWRGGGGPGVGCTPLAHLRPPAGRWPARPTQAGAS